MDRYAFIVFPFGVHLKCKMILTIILVSDRNLLYFTAAFFASAGSQVL
jgi:hypothetical protein